MFPYIYFKKPQLKKNPISLRWHKKNFQEPHSFALEIILEKYLYRENKNPGFTFSSVLCACVLWTSLYSKDLALSDYFPACQNQAGSREETACKLAQLPILEHQQVTAVRI